MWVEGGVLLIFWTNICKPNKYDGLRIQDLKLRRQVALARLTVMVILILYLYGLILCLLSIASSGLGIAIVYLVSVQSFGNKCVRRHIDGLCPLLGKLDQRNE